MKYHENEKYFKLALTGVAIVTVSLLFFFLLFHLPEIWAALGAVLGILAPFLHGAVIAYVLTPLCNRLEGRLRKLLPKSRRLPGPLAIALSLILALLTVLALLMLVLPRVGDSLVQIVIALPGQVDSAIQWFHDLLGRQPQLQVWWDSFSSEAITKAGTWVETNLVPTAQTVLGGLGVQVTGFLNEIKNLILGVLISAYLLAIRKRFAIQAKMLLCGIFPRHWADMIEEEARYADKMFNGFLMGKLLDSAIIGVICFVFTSILGFKSAALIAVVVGITNIIPFFGPLLGAIPCALLLLLENPMHCLIFLVFIVVLQQLDGNLIGPKILGNTTGLNSFWVLFSILLFGGLWGLFGMIVGVPLFAVLYDILRRLVYRGLRRHGRTDLLAQRPDKLEE